MEQKYIRYVANYFRKSRGDSDNDLEKHKKVLRELCESNGWKYIDYCEIGSGDSITDRSVFQRLLYDVESEMFDAVCVMDIDRLGRGDMGDQDRIKKSFIKSDTYVVTPQQVYNLKNDDDEFVVDMKSFIARREYKQIVKRLSQGKKIGSKMGMWTNGTPPYPYEYQKYKDKSNPKGLIVNDEKLLVYRTMVDSIINKKMTPAQIAWDLNTAGTPSPRGGNWHGGTIERILKSEVHLGKIIANKTKGDGHANKTKKNPVEAIPKDKWVIVEGCHEAVKTQDEHEEILLFLSRLTNAPKRKPIEVKPLTGLMKCGLCGHTMTHNVREERKGRESLKPCWYKNEIGQKCRNKGASTDVIYSAIYEEVKKQKENITESILARKAMCANNSTKERESIILNEISKKEIALERILNAFEVGAYSLSQFKERKQKTEKSIDKLKQDLELVRIETNKNNTSMLEEQLERINYFLDKINTSFSNKEKNLLYKSIIDRIEWIKQGKNLNMKILFKQ